jgi:hypothetical protein
MADFASLVLSVDTTGLKKGERALNETTRAGVATERAVKGTGRGFDKAGRSASTATPKVAAFGVATDTTRGMALAATRALTAMAVSLGAVIVAGVGLNKFVGATVEADASQAQLAAAILSTGGAANRTLDQLNQHAAALQGVTNFGDEATNAMQGLLLTFTAIQGDVFDQATVAVLDLATAMGTDLNAAALQVGKALNDPVLGMTALSRSGIQFTQAQKDVVAAMVETNDIAGAQAIILAELEKQFGGSAEAARGTLGGALRSLSNAFGDLFEISGEGSAALRAAVESLIDTISDPKFVSSIQSAGVALFRMAEVGLKAMAGLVAIFLATGQFVEDFKGQIIAAALVLTVVYTPAIVAATVATAAWVASLITVRGALIATGIGAVVVVAGMLINRFLLLVEKTGSVGDAFNLLKDVAVEAFGRIGTAFEIVPAAVSLGALKMAHFFSQNLYKMAFDFALFTQDIAEGLNNLFGTSLSGMSTSGLYGSGLGQAMRALGTDVAFAEARVNGLSDALTAPLKSIDALRDAMADANGEIIPAGEASEVLAAELDAVNDALSGSGGTTAAAKELADVFKDQLSSAVDSVANAFGDWISSGFQNFKGMMDSIVNSFKSMISQLISTAIANPIKLALGIGGGAATTAATTAAGGAAGAAAGGGGLLGNALGGFGTAGGGILGGLGGGTGALGGLGNALSGGLGNVFSVGANAAAAGGGIMATLGAAVPIIGAIGLAFSLFRTKTKQLDAGIIATVTGMDTLVQSFNTVEKSRFFGLFKSVSTTISGASAATTDAITGVVDALQGGVLASADALGIAGDTFADFSHRMQVSTKGLSEEAANDKIQAALMGMADAMAGMVSGLDAFARDGEGAATTLERLAFDLSTVNNVFRDLGFAAYNVSLAGADAASQFADLFGSLQNFTAASSAYYDQFFTNDEKMANATSRLTESLAALGVNFVPDTRAGFRDLVETAMLGGDSDLAANLIMLAPAFASVTEAANTLSDAILLSINENAFATGVDFRRGLARAAGGIEYTPQQSQAEMLAELKALNARIDVLQSTSEITANSSSQTAENTDYSNALTLEAAT